jgi:type II restriction enzyme
MISVKLSDNTIVELSPGKHNAVQAAVIHEFAPRFAPGATLLYLGDAEKKMLVIDEATLNAIGLTLDDHGKLPDIVLLDTTRQRLLIEAVTSHGPMTPKRVRELAVLFEKSALGKIYISAFPDFGEFRRHLKQIAWDTDVWLVDFPDHLIHYNGDQFLVAR